MMLFSIIMQYSLFYLWLFFSAVEIRQVGSSCRHVGNHGIEKGDRTHGFNDDNCAGDNDRVVAPVNIDIHRFSGLCYRFLRLRNGRRRLDMAAQENP